MKKSRFREEQMVTILLCRRSRVGEWAVSDPCPSGLFPVVVVPRPLSRVLPGGVGHRFLPG